MNRTREIWWCGLIAVTVVAAASVPAGLTGGTPATEAALLLRVYAREHLPFALLPALLLAGAIQTFPQRAAIARRLGPGAPAPVAYGLAALAGAGLAVCSCAVLPLFAALYLGGAGLGPAVTLLYAGPAINVLAVTLTAAVLGPELGIVRAVSAVTFSVVVGLVMAALFRTPAPTAPAPTPPPSETRRRRPWQTGVTIAALAVAALAINGAANGRITIGLQCCVGGKVERFIEGRIVARTPNAITLRDAQGRDHLVPKLLMGSVRGADGPLARALHASRVPLAAASLIVALGLLGRWFTPEERREWCRNSWALTRRMVPLLLLGVAATGLLVGRPQHGGLLPSHWIEAAVGATPDLFLQMSACPNELAPLLRCGWPVWTNLTAATAGACMYFASLTEVPIVGGLQGAGMARGPALAMLLAGPALSLPNLLVIRTVLGTRKTLTYAVLVILAATASGVAYGALG